MQTRAKSKNKDKTGSSTSSNSSDPSLNSTPPQNRVRRTTNPAPTRDYMIPRSSAELAMEEDLKALTMDVIALAQSLTDYVYEMGEHDEGAYDARGEIFEEDVNYTAQGEDYHYIPMHEYKIANYYNPPPLQKQQGQGDDRGDEEQEEPTLTQLMTQMKAMQAQQGKDIQLLTSELQQERAARKLLETQFTQQASSSSQNPEEFPLKPDARLADAITLKSDKVLEEPKGTDRASSEVVKEDVQLEHVKEKEVVEQETPCVAPPAYIPHMHFPHRQIKVHVKTIDGDKVIDVCLQTFFGSKVLSNKHAKNSDTVGDNLNDVVKKSFHKGPEILICNTRLKDETTMSLPGH